MASYTRIGGARRISAAAVLGLGLMWASSGAKADYSYTFTLLPTSGTGADASGMFTLDSLPVTSFALFTSIDAVLYSGGNSYIIDQVIRGSNVRPGSLNIVGSIGTTFLGPGSSLAFYGTPTISNKEIKGSVNTIYSTQSSPSSFFDGQSVFDAILSSGGSSGGGSSGGAPTPEVNAALSFIIVGATFVFLRRKRGGRSGSVAA